ncbi:MULTISPECIES: DUF3887 domain-containing protein [Oceanobacillus]|uniref:DUF3887 domain-containing protein n=1 Tax=Oceanobacillus indicireducens TaxID=1004261 RepID=A0A917Y303_9BACI|nr:MULTISPECIES: DUF3887 domain-containing protein [Oceanobacillus]GGN64775.1 hypothetical protein GCM10007971_33000 [Oceanobacillus indicireducens]
MKKLQVVSFLLIAAILFLAGCSGGKNTEESVETPEEGIEPAEEQTTDENGDGTRDEAVVVAEEFIDQLSDGQYEEATENFDETMAAQVGAEELQEIWGSLEEQLGDFIAFEYKETEEVEDHEVVLIKGVFNDADITFQVTVNENMEIAGFYMV